MNSEEEVQVAAFGKAISPDMLSKSIALFAGDALQPDMMAFSIR